MATACSSVLRSKELNQRRKYGILGVDLDFLVQGKCRVGRA